MKLDEALLLSGNDIPFEKARITIHNPTFKEISFYGEAVFHIGSQFLIFSKDKLPQDEQEELKGKSDFEVFLSIMTSPIKAEHKTNAKKVLSILFPGATIEYKSTEMDIYIQENIAVINQQNFEEFQSILTQMFCLQQLTGDEYNPRDGYAKRIAEKLKKRHQQLAKQTGAENKMNIYSQYASILAIGLKMNLNDVMNYTIYQLRDQMQRFTLEKNSEIYFQAKLAGAQGLDEVENWMDDIHKDE